jgi:hypothetical protein
MLQIIRNWKLRDYLRSYQGLRNHGIPASKNYMAIQWMGAYSPSDRGIVYFVARQIDNSSEIIENYDIGAAWIKFESGQYLYDNTKTFDGILPDGIFFFEFNDGVETYWSEIFCVKAVETLMLASGVQVASGSWGVSDVNIENPDPILLKTFEENILYEFEN